MLPAAPVTVTIRGSAMSGAPLQSCGLVPLQSRGSPRSTF